ncbi:MAG: endonuclease/exonuclease/phosphatase [Planctomycetaceae bacterium]|nr:endonuclease/exonuclease/phosphatase [Planctomycetaceae bacterium]
MGSSRFLLTIAVVVVGIWLLLDRYEIRGLQELKLVRRNRVEDRGLPPAARTQGTIRIASFNLEEFGPTKADKPDVMEIIADTIRRFDVVALQEIRTERPEVLQKLLTQINATGRHYALLASPPVGRTASKEQFAFVFDQATIEVDRSAVYTVDDPDDLLHWPPFVGWFRVRGPASDQAFTFTLANLHLDPDEVAEEIRVLDNVFFSIRDDGRGEDDLILIGDFNTDDRQFGELGQVSGMMAAISQTPTNTRQTQQYANLVFQLPATSEYMGQSGVFDFLREYNLTLEQALQVSKHLPVWAEFSMHEGGTLPVIAASDAPAAVR